MFGPSMLPVLTPWVKLHCSVTVEFLPSFPHFFEVTVERTSISELRRNFQFIQEEYLRRQASSASQAPEQ
jgi:hypothetical protein